jgi:1,4-dihydroxy-2-naphthoate octaprenyltransferase
VKNVLSISRSFFDFFLFSSLFIAGCAVLMVQQTAHPFLHGAVGWPFYLFVFFSTICSYNFHWHLTQQSATGSERLRWALRHKQVHLVLYIAGLMGAAVFFIYIREHWFWIGVGAVVTFLYSAPKIPHPLFRRLKKIAIGKTFFLAFVWMYITTLLPMLISGERWQPEFTWFAFSRFFLIYAICILFDYRDREDDRQDDIKSMITYFNEHGINNLFALSLCLFVLFTLLLALSGFGWLKLVLLLAPGVIVALLYPYAKKHFSDYLYYFALDGLMMFSALLMLIFRI